MIFVFDDSLTAIDRDEKVALAKLIVAIVEKKHYVKVVFSLWQWVEREVLIGDFLGTIDIELIRKNKEFRDITGIMTNYLTQINVGYGQDFIQPSLAKVLVDKPSYVVVENEANDWLVLRKWIELMKNDRAFKSINILVEKKKQDRLIIPYNAGSAGQIINILRERMADFGTLSRYKVMAVCDSDKKSIGEELSKEKKKIQDFSNERGLMHHQLYKREMENYFSLDCYIKAGFADNGLTYSLSEQDWDFEDVEEYIKINSKGKSYDKKGLPLLCNYIDKKTLMRRTAHHPLDYEGKSINEIQLIILKFAKLV